MNKHEVNPGVLKGRHIAVSPSLDTMDRIEAMDIIAECGGDPQKNLSANTDTLLVGNTTIGALPAPAFIENAKRRGIRVISESEIAELTGVACGTSVDADRWVLVDDFLRAGKVDMENNRGWDGSIPPYKLYIQRTTKKSTTDGGWKIIDYGVLSDKGYPQQGLQPWYTNPNKLSDGQIPSMPSPRGSEPNIAGLSEEEARPILDRYNSSLKGFDKAVSRFDYRQLIGTIRVKDHWAPASCAYLFDGLTYLTEANLLYLDTSRATSMKAMFRGCSSLEYMLDSDRFATSNVEDYSMMFMNCSKLRVASMGGWKLRPSVDMENMFENSSAYALWDRNNAEKLRDIGLQKIFGSGISEGSWFKS